MKSQISFQVLEFLSNVIKLGNAVDVLVLVLVRRRRQKSLDDVTVPSVASATVRPVRELDESCLSEPREAV